MILIENVKNDKKYKKYIFIEISWSVLFFFLVFGLLSLDYNQDELIVRSNQNLIFWGFQSHELEIIMSVKIPDGHFGLRN